VLEELQELDSIFKQGLAWQDLSDRECGLPGLYSGQPDTFFIGKSGHVNRLGVNLLDNFTMISCTIIFYLLT
jgi:hypothetical protein